MKMITHKSWESENHCITLHNFISDVSKIYIYKKKIMLDYHGAEMVDNKV